MTTIPMDSADQNTIETISCLICEAVCEVWCPGSTPSFSVYSEIPIARYSHRNKEEEYWPC